MFLQEMQPVQRLANKRQGVVAINIVLNRLITRRMEMRRALQTMHRNRLGEAHLQAASELLEIEMQVLQLWKIVNRAVMTMTRPAVVRSNAWSKKQSCRITET